VLIHISVQGPFDLVFKQLYNCNPTKNNKIQHNMYIGHRGNSSWLLGNSTLEIPLDDTLFVSGFNLTNVATY